MTHGRPKGSKNKQRDQPPQIQPPTNWGLKIRDLVQTRHRSLRDFGAELPNNFGECTPYRTFKLLWTDKMEQHVLQRTCQKAVLNGDHTPSAEVLQRFLLAGLMICVNVRSNFKLHWSSDPLLANQELKSLISRNTFQSTLNLIHPDPQILEDMANLNFRAQWHPLDHVSIDEGLVCFKGRYQHRVHIRGKPDATGLKIYGLADQAGYMYAFDLYKGDKSTIPEIVMGLLEKLPSQNFKVYANSWYDSENLALLLLQRGYLFTLGCGKNKPASLFNDYLDKSLSKGQVRYLQHEKYDKLLALSYNDRAKCHFFTNLFRPGFTETLKNKKIPVVVEDYWHYIGSVDRVDRSAKLACWPHKNSRWTMAFLWYLLGLCVSNARLILAYYNNVSYNLSDFLVDLIREWRSELDTKKSAPRHPVHRLEKSTSKARCAVCCKIDRNISKTALFCIVCKIYLHHKCFTEYHKTM
jgi:hypothetical protein